MILSLLLFYASKGQTVINLIERFPLVFVLIISIISFTAIIILFVFKYSKSIQYIEWGNAILRLRLKRNEKKKK